MEFQIESAVFTAILIGCAGYAALFIAPDESTMHAIQRIFYFHAPTAWAGMDASAITFIANIAYLATKRPKWDWIGVASTEVGLVCTTVVLLTGPIWAHPVWGIWWTWDARLTSTLLMWLLYVAYLMLRKMMDTPSERLRTPRFLEYSRFSMSPWFTFRFGSGGPSIPLRWCLAGAWIRRCPRYFSFAYW